VLTPQEQDRLEQLRSTIRGCGSALVAYSGGVDSALVMAIAHEQLGAKMLACIGSSPSYPQREMREAVQLAEDRGVPYRIVATEEHLDARYAANPDNRCYFCKSELHDRLKEIAAAEGWAVVLDGNNASDRADDRPGMQAGQERGVRSPLREVEATKQDVRALARAIGLSVWDKPAAPCLSSRVPHGVAITPELLKQIEAAEDVLVAAGFREFRVRHHGELARIEVPGKDLPRLIERREEIVRGIKAAGYLHVTVDLAGFRSSGAMPETLYALGISRSTLV
jgi:uncharacterized protein